MSQDRDLVIRSLRRRAEVAREGQDPEAHPSVEDLVAYHGNELSAEEDRTIQDPLVACRECPELILALDGFADLPAGEGGIAPAEVDSAWERVRQRLAGEGWFRGERDETSWPWHMLLAPQRRLVATMAIVALACLGAFLVLADRNPRIVDQTEVGATSWDLPPATRGPAEKIVVSSTAGHFYLVMAPDGPQTYPEYQVELRTAGEQGKVWWHSPWHPKSDAAELFLRIPHGFLPAGKYQVKLQGLAGGRPVREAVDERSFQLSYR